MPCRILYEQIMISVWQALRWEVVPVITDFDPRFNNAKPLWFEKLYQPFLSGDLKTRSVATDT